MLKEIYLVHFDGRVGALGCVQGNPHHFYSICPKGKFADWVQGLIEDYPDFKLRCVKNDGIEEYLRERNKIVDIGDKRNRPRSSESGQRRT